jgi:predicted  nucleic acid-binding Zn-ribbon protein
MRFGMSMLAALLLAGSVTFAQTATDIATLERKVRDAQAAYSRVQPAGDEQELREIEDDLAYLRVKARRGETVTARERRDLSDRIDRFMVRMNGRTSSTTGITERQPRANRGVGRGQLPAGSEVDVRLQTLLDSETAQVEDRVEATTMVDLYQGNDLLVPAGSMLEGYVSSVDRASRTDRKGELTIMFTRLKVNGRTHDIRAYPTQVLESEGIKGEAERIGAGAGVGAIIGGILGGLKGAITGILIGGGGVIAATEGKDVELPPGTVLRVRFDSPVSLAQ